MKIRYIVPVLALMGALTACEDYNDQFDFLENNGITDVKNLEVALGSSDYATIADLEANQNLAAVKEDQGGGNYVEALAAVKENKYFTTDAPATDYIPAWLVNRYPEATDGSRIKVTYNEYRAVPEYMAALSNVSAYTLTEKDYQTVWGESKEVLYLTPKSISKVSTVLSEAYPSAADGDKVLVSYAYDDVEPSIGGGSQDESIVAYMPVTSVDEEGGQYIIAAKADDGNYYPFGSTASWSRDYGYFYPKTPLAFTDGALSAEIGATEGVTLEKGTNGFLVKNGEEYYLYMSGTYNSFNRTASIPASGAEWSFTPNSDGTMLMQNIEKEKAVKLTLYNESYSFGAYPKATYDGVSYFDDPCSSASTTKFVMKDVQLPEGSTYVWKVDETNKYWKASAYVGGSNKASESYIVSPEIDLTESTAPMLTWTEAINFIKEGQTVSDLAVCVSTDYAGDAQAATWTALAPEARGTGTSWAKVQAQADLSAYKGQKIYVAFKYVSTTTSASTWEVWNVKVKEPAPSNYWDVYLYKGMTQSELDEAGMASYAQMAVRAASNVIATRAAGDVKANTSVLYVYNAEDAVWEVCSLEGVTVAAVDPATYESLGTNYLMRPNTQIPVFLTQKYPYATNGTVVAVLYINSKDQLVAGEYKYSSGTWNEQTTVASKKLTFELTDGNWVAGANSYFENTLLGDEAGFTACNISLSGSLTYVWTNTSNYGWKGSAYANSTQNASESWLVSPAIFLEDSEAPVLTFDEAANKMGAGKVDDMFTVWVTTDSEEFDKNSDVSACSWTQLTLNTRAAGESWDFVNIGEVDLSEYNGETIRIALKYTSTTEGAGTWEVKNFSVAERSE